MKKQASLPPILSLILPPILPLILLFICVFSSHPAWANGSDLLKLSDIHKIMDQILKQHVDRKEMSVSLLKGSLKNYIDQFDPDRIYLLESEVEPYLQPTDTAIQQALDQYQHNDLAIYFRLNQVIQNAIRRARQIRSELEKERSKLFQEHKANPNPRPDDDLHSRFAKNVQELKRRIRSDFLLFLSEASRQYGIAAVTRDEAKTAALYERKVREIENQYLGTDEAGNPLPPPQQENLFALHVLKSLASTLDAHTKFMNSQEAYDMKMRLEKEYRGIGVLLKKQNENVVVASLVPGSTVEKNGSVKVNDRIVAINGQSLAELPFDRVLEMIRNEETPVVVLDIRRHEKGQPEQQLKVQLKRETVGINEGRVEITCEPFKDGLIGTVALHMFYQGDNGVSSESDMREAIKRLKDQGKLYGLVLDLRDNTGGFLMQAVKVASLFIKSGIVVISKYSSGEERIYRDIDGQAAFDGPLVILTSRETASAAEIVAQTLQDYGVALIVGDEQTYGKGTIQNQTVTDNQNASFFKVTVGTYYTVSGKTPQLQGVKADIVVPSFFNNEPIGEGFLDERQMPISRIKALYKDPLTDIDTVLKPWYLSHYTENMQHRETVWRKMLPELRKNSAKRIAHNKPYQILLSEGEATVASGEGKPIKKGWLFPERNTDQDDDDDLQMTEAVNIIKDMALLKSKG